MCGIIGYTGRKSACPILLDGLQTLEYRGYDSAGILVEENGAFTFVKKAGRLENLRQALAGRTIEGTCGIGHTRWATHGGPTDENAHPHGTPRVMLVHNGIFENYLDLKADLLKQGYTFSSQTDTEVIACAIDSRYHGDPIAAIRSVLADTVGAYALAILFADRPGEIYAARQNAPLLIALGEGETFLASDLCGVIEHTNRYYPLEEGELAVLTPDGCTVFDAQGRQIEKAVLEVDWTIEQAQKDGYEDFMLKEIHEQPDALRNTVTPRVREGLPCFDADGVTDAFLARFRRIHIIGCGTAMHAGLVGRAVIEKLARIPVAVEVASEFRYNDPILTPDTLVVVISQSGETADSLAALRLAKERGCMTLAVVNVAGSSIARAADRVIYTYAGPEVSVCSTKAYTVQLAVMYLLAFQLARVNLRITDEQAEHLTASLLAAGDAIRSVVELDALFCEQAASLQSEEHLFFLGRGLDYALACEGSLKLKEISYIHCEAYAAGELKHGTISLITDGVPVIALATQGPLFGKVLSNIREVKARGARVLLIARKDARDLCSEADGLIPLPEGEDLFLPFAAVTALQLIAYHTAKLRGCDIDKPRNLAKSVTVE